MSHTRFRVEFSAAEGDDDFELDRLTRELAADLAELGEVGYEPAPPEPDAKGALEVVAAVLTVVTASDPGYLQAVVETVVAFLDRNAGRRAHLRVGDVELTIGRPGGVEVAQMIDIVRSAIERADR